MKTKKRLLSILLSLALMLGMSLTVYAAADPELPTSTVSLAATVAVTGVDLHFDGSMTITVGQTVTFTAGVYPVLNFTLL